MNRAQYPARSSAHCMSATASATPAPSFPSRHPPPPPRDEGFVDYRKDFICALVQPEDFRLPLPDFLQHQAELSEQSRATLVRWMVDIAHQLGFQPRTLALAVNCLDRYLSKRRVPLADFQLVGATSLLLATKYEETPAYALTLSTTARLCRFYWHPDDIATMECRLATVLGFDLEWHGPLDILDALREPVASASTSTTDSESPAAVTDHEANESTAFTPVPRRDSGVDVSDEIFELPTRRYASRAADACICVAGTVPRDCMALARNLVEMSYADSHFGSVRSPSLAIAALAAARRLIARERLGVDEALDCCWSYLMSFDPEIEDVASDLIAMVESAH